MIKKSKIIPAVDIRGGKSVRLHQGDYSKEKIYSDDPVLTAKKWDVEGIGFIHIVDLDGAREGRPVNKEIIAKIAKSVRAKIEAGGGIRTETDAEELLSAGASRIILGTTVCENPSAAKKFVNEFGADKIIAGIDAKNGIAATRGWISSSGSDIFELAAKFADSGIIRIIYTDISVDGALSGPNIESTHRLCGKFPSMKFIASGGVSSLEDIKRLFRSAPPNLEAVIVGKALYEGKFSIEDAASI